MESKAERGNVRGASGFDICAYGPCYPIHVTTTALVALAKGREAFKRAGLLAECETVLLFL